MRKRCFLLLALSPLSVAAPQATSPGVFQCWPASTMNQIGQTLAQQAASDPHHFAAQQLGDFPNEAILYVHREADGQPELHETQVDVVFVHSGTATLLVGGTLINAETVAPHEKRNGTIQGGVRQKIGPGDLLRIPPNTPHQLLLDGSKDFTYIVVKAKGY